MRMRKHPRAGWVAVLARCLAGLLVATFIPAVITPAAASEGFATAASHREAYVLADQPTTSRYVAATGYEYSSAGQPIEITRTSTGVYTVRFVGLASSDGVAHVLAYGNGNSGLCAISSFGRSGSHMLVQVRCYNAGGAPADSQFVASFTDQQAAPADTYLAYLWSNQAAPPAAYLPARAYDSTGEPVVVTRTGVGQYRVKLGALDATWPGPYWDGFFTATAFSRHPVRCDVLDAFHFIPHDLPVRCHRADGSPVDSQFTLTYSNRINVLGSPANHASAMVKPEGNQAPFVVQWWGSATAPTATRLGVGDYLVFFPIGGTAFGHAVASLQGIMVAPQYCTIAGWLPLGEFQQVRVNCWEGDGSGTPADVWAFNVAFTP